MPFGVNYLWDPRATLALGGGDRGKLRPRDLHRRSSPGTWASGSRAAREALRLRAELGRPDIRLLFNINAEFAASLDTRPIEVRAKSAVFSSLADVLCVSGPMTGAAVDELRELQRVKDGGRYAGLRQHRRPIETVEEILSLADGCVVGTHQGRRRHLERRSTATASARFMDNVRGLR